MGIPIPHHDRLLLRALSPRRGCTSSHTTISFVIPPPMHTAGWWRGGEGVEIDCSALPVLLFYGEGKERGRLLLLYGNGLL